MSEQGDGPQIEEGRQLAFGEISSGNPPITDIVLQPPQTSGESEELSPQIPIVIPGEIRSSQLMNQRPDGSVLYVDYRNPDIATVINPKTWRPEMTQKKPSNRKEPKQLVLSKISGRRIAAIIYHTPPRTPDNAFEEDLANAGTILRQSHEMLTDEKRNPYPHHHLGALFIVEDKADGGDMIKDWRKKSINNIGLTMSIDEFTNNDEGVVEVAKKPLPIVETGNFFITQARVPKKHLDVDLNRSRAGNYIKSMIEQTEAAQDRLGVAADSSRLKQEIRNSSVPPATIGRVIDSGNITLSNRSTGSITEVTKSGDIFKSRAGTDDYAEPGQEELRKPKKENPFVELLKDPCSECGGHFHVAESDRWKFKGHIYKKETVICNGSHGDGYPKSRGKPRIVKVQ